MASDYQVSGKSPGAPFTLKVHRGDGMTLLAMNWKKGEPPDDFVGFAIGYREPGGDRFYLLKNRLAFPTAQGAFDPSKLVTMLSPIQMFRWVHFPRNAELPGEFDYQVTPVFMSAAGDLSYGEPQEASIELRRAARAQEAAACRRGHPVVEELLRRPAEDPRPRALRLSGRLRLGRRGVGAGTLPGLVLREVALRQEPRPVPVDLDRVVRVLHDDGLRDPW
jgi:hypothetical protein